MTVYSHSRLSCFEQCPQKFKYQYIDKLETEVEETVEAFLGVRVHEALEKLYKDLQHQKPLTLDGLLDFVRSEWKASWSDDIVIVKSEYTAENYLRMAEKFLSDYYRRYAPFTREKTIALEEKITIDLDGDGEYRLQGYIDRLAEAGQGSYEIHDYKTNSRLPLAAYLKKDRQLALYMIGVKAHYPDARDVRLIWHFVAFDKELDSTRTEAELQALKDQTRQLIDMIEAEEKYPASPSFLCDWCEFKGVCGQWSHLYKIKEEPAGYQANNGVQLVNRYAELKAKQKQASAEFDAEAARLEEAILAYASKEKIDVVFGSTNKVRVTASERFVFPAKHSKERDEIEALLKKHGLHAEVASLDTTAVGKCLAEKKWPPEVCEALHKYITVEQSKRIYLSNLKNVEIRITFKP
jgi:putative RecB family exonuclease